MISTPNPQISHCQSISLWKANIEIGESTEEVHLGQRFDKGNQKEFDID